MSDEIERLKARVSETRAARDEAQRQLDEAERELLEERFRDVPHFSKGDAVLVRRVVGPNIVWWPAKIVGVHLKYTEGRWPDTYTKDPGGAFESKSITYTAEYEQANGKTVSNGFWANEVQLPPAAQE